MQTRRINRAGVSVIMVEQNARRCLQICDRGYVLDQGRNAYTGTGRDAAQRPQGDRALPGHARPHRLLKRTPGLPRGRPRTVPPTPAGRTARCINEKIGLSPMYGEGPISSLRVDRRRFCVTWSSDVLVPIT